MACSNLGMDPLLLVVAFFFYLNLDEQVAHLFFLKFQHVLELWSSLWSSACCVFTDEYKSSINPLVPFYFFLCKDQCR